MTERASQSRGLGDRWLAGESIAGVTFAQGDLVAIDAGRHAGRQSRVLLLVDGPPAPVYLVDLGDPRPTRVTQAALAPIS